MNDRRSLECDGLILESPALLWALRGLALLVFAGTLAGTPSSWGFDHLAYLPRWLAVAMIPFAAALFWPWRSVAGAHAESSRAYRILLQGRLGTIAWVIAAGGLLVAMRTRTHLLGDGYLLLDVLGRGGEAHPFESLGFLVLRQCRRLFAAATDPSLSTYRTAAIVAGLGGFVLVRLLLPRTAWEPRRQLTFLLLHLASAATLLYCGYVENYAFLYAFLTAFTLAGVATAAGCASIRLPGLLLGAAVAAHLSALLAVPALIVLAFAGEPGAARRRRLILALAPVVGVLLVLAAVLASGSVGFLRGDANLARPLRPLLGDGGIISLRVPLDVVNLALLVVPVPFVMLLASWRPRRRVALPGPEGRFLGAHALALLAAAILVDPKLGAARDWDLLAPHAASVLALALLVVPCRSYLPGRLAAAACLCALPWFALGVDAGGSVARMATVARAFRPYARAYAYEGLGKYERTQGNLAEVEKMYQAAIEAQPDNARFHALLGATYVSLYNESDEKGAPRERYMELAEVSYRQAQRINPIYPAVMDNLARLCVRKDRFREAEELLTALSKRQALSVAQLKMLLYCQHRLGEYDLVGTTRERLLALDPRAEIPPAWLASPNSTRSQLPPADPSP